MYYRSSGKEPGVQPGETHRERSRRELMALAASDQPPGLIGYRGAKPVGWVSLGPRGDFAKLQNSPVMKPADGQSVWSVVCFVVPLEYRRQGVARQLLVAAVK
jgi:ribosomal protein S18 acetylase RimI-like enzyme